MDSLAALQALAESYNVQTFYWDDKGQRQEASPEALTAVLRVLGASLQNPEEAEAGLRERRQALWRTPLEPVTVAWDGNPAEVALRLPASSSGSLHYHLILESGTEQSWSVPVAELPVTETAEVEGTRFAVHRLSLPGSLPMGYHRLMVERAGQSSSCHVFAAPSRSYAPPSGPLKTWGTFLPVYALRTARDWGAGDFTDLEALIGWTQALGGGLVGTLPMLAAFLDQPFEPSPYSPASRLFWNELYLDPTRCPELERSPSARAFIASTEFEQERQALRATSLVDYRRLMALKRRVLTELARAFFASPGPRQEAFQRYLDSHPRAPDYARFRAAGEKQQATWWTWPERMRRGDVVEGDYEQTHYRYHLYVQWQAHEQIGSLGARARAAGPGLYLDLPLGVNSDSYDVWRERDSFALGVSGGAPPDIFFTRGQDWGFPPLHPENARARGYHYFRDVIRHHLRHAGLLRIDHLMGLHRLYWVPHGLSARQGVYVRYRPEELYALLNIESHRHRSVLAGEDLGTVPEGVRPAMERHNVHRLYVVQYEAQPNPDRPIPPVYPGAVASVNTHDMPTFAGFWKGLDVADRKELGLLDEEACRQEHARRQAIRDSFVGFLRRQGWLGDATDASSVLKAILQYLAAEPSQVVLAGLEDLWEAPDPQNVPGTWHERPNWRRKAAHPLESFDSLPNLRDTLKALDQVTRKRS
jgi:4-alpha-glucanotransferase